MRRLNKYRSWKELLKLIEDEDYINDEPFKRIKKKREKVPRFDWKRELKQIEQEWEEFMQKEGAIHSIPNCYLIGELHPTGIETVPGAHPAVLVYQTPGVFYWAHGTSQKKKVREIISTWGCSYETLYKKTLTKLNYNTFIKEIRRQKPQSEKIFERIKQEHQIKFPNKDLYFFSCWSLLHRSPWRPKKNTFICLSSHNWFSRLQIDMS